SLASAESQAAGGDLAAAIRILEVSLPDFDRVIDNARAERERARERAAAQVERERAEAALSKADALGERARAHVRFAPAGAELESWVGALLNDAATRRAEKPKAGSPWKLVAIGGGVAAAGAALLFATRGEPPEPRIARKSQTPVVTAPTALPIPPTARPEVRA